MSIGEICSRIVATASECETIRSAAERMGELDVGTLVVVGRGYPQKPIGIVTDRDLALRCIAEGLSDETALAQIMTQPVRTVSEHASVEEAVELMARGGTRRLAVTGDDNELVGLLSLDDLLDVVVGEMAAIGDLLEQQQPRIPT